MNTSQVAQLESLIARYQGEVSELNRRLSAQNRPGLRLQSVVEAATIILSQHIAGKETGRRSIQRDYPHIGRRKWEYGTALLRLAGIVTGHSGAGLIFNDGLTVNRAWEKLRATATAIDTVSQLAHFLPRGRQ